MDRLHQIPPLSRRVRRGFTLLEMAIVLTAIGAIAGTIFYVAAPLQEDSRVSDALNRMNIITQGMTTMLQGGYRSTAGTYISQKMITAGVVPLWMVTPQTVAPNQTIDTLWKSAAGLDIIWETTPPAAPKYRLKFYNVGTIDGCISLVTRATNCVVGQSGCPVNVGTNAMGSQIDLTATTPTSTKVQALCAANNYTTDLNNSVEFDFIN